MSLCVAHGVQDESLVPLVYTRKRLPLARGQVESLAPPYIRYSLALVGEHEVRGRNPGASIRSLLV